MEPYFPGLKNADKITVENLLKHSSGIHDFTSEADYLDWHTTYQSKEKTMDRILIKDLKISSSFLICTTISTARAKKMTQEE